MSESTAPKESVWDRLAREITSPWDWVAAGVGAAGGAGATLILHGGDLGTSVGLGAIGAVTARKAGAASFTGRGLRKRKSSIEAEISKIENQQLQRQLSNELESDFRLWSTDGVSNGQFAATLDRITRRQLERTGVIPRSHHRFGPVQ